MQISAVHRYRLCIVCTIINLIYANFSKLLASHPPTSPKCWSASLRSFKYSHNSEWYKIQYSQGQRTHYFISSLRSLSQWIQTIKRCHFDYRFDNVDARHNSKRHVSARSYTLRTCKPAAFLKGEFPSQTKDLTGMDVRLTSFHAFQVLFYPCYWKTSSWLNLIGTLEWFLHHSLEVMEQVPVLQISSDVSECMRNWKEGGLHPQVHHWMRLQTDWDDTCGEAPDHLHLQGLFIEVFKSSYRNSRIKMRLWGLIAARTVWSIFIALLLFPVDIFRFSLYGKYHEISYNCVKCFLTGT